MDSRDLAGTASRDGASETEALSRCALDQRLDRQKELEAAERRRQTLDWLLAATQGFRAIEASLTVKPSVGHDVLNAYDAFGAWGLPALERKHLAIATENRSGRHSFVTENVMSAELEKTLHRFLRSVGKEYRPGTKRNPAKKQLAIIPTFEGDGVTKNRHVHLFIEWPQGLLISHVREKLAAAWDASLWSLPVMKIAPVRNILAYITYMLKGGLENLDVCNTWLPITRIG